MTRAVDIALVERRYRMPDADRKVRRRLDELTETLLRDRLPGILERQGVRPDDAVCLRVLRLDLAYRPGMSAADCLDHWTARLAESVKEAMARGSDRALVHYRSRVHAFLDAAAALAEGRLERGWAWHRLGVTGSDHRASRASLARQWRDRLAEAPELAPAAAALARTGGALRLLERDVLEPSDMDLLGRAVLAAQGVSDGAAAAGRPAPPDKDPRAPDPARAMAAAGPDPVAGRRAEAIRRGSSLLATLRGRTPSGDAAAMAVWAILEVEPGLLRAPRDDLGRLLAILAEEIGNGPRTEPPKRSAEDARTPHAPAARPDPPFRPPWPDGAPPATASPRPDAPRAPAAPDPAASAPDRHPGAESARPAPDAAARAPEPRTRTPGEPRPAPGLSDIPRARVPYETAADDAPAEDDPLRTEWGGLILWLNGFARFDVVDALLRDKALSGRPLSLLTEALATLATSCPTDDPALAVFAGRAPGTDAWAATAPPLDPEERAALARHLDMFRDALHAVLPERSPDRLLIELAPRPARIRWSPGWIVATFPLRTVEIDIRMAGLDLHPEHVPWLGAIVRVEYEAGP